MSPGFRVFGLLAGVPRGPLGFVFPLELSKKRLPARRQQKSRDAAGIRLSTHFFDYAVTLHRDRHGVKDYFPNYILDKVRP